MTLAAFCNFEMSAMAEMCGAGLFYLVCYLLNRMTCDACIESESFLAVMTRTTRFTLLHICHCKLFIGAGGKNRRVTCATIIGFGKMQFMTESGWPCCPDFVHYFFCLMATD